MFTFMDCVAYRWGRIGCSSPSTKVLHGSTITQSNGPECCSSVFQVRYPTFSVAPSCNKMGKNRKWTHEHCGIIFRRWSGVHGGGGGLLLLFILFHHIDKISFCILRICRLAGRAQCDQIWWNFISLWQHL